MGEKKSGVGYVLTRRVKSRYKVKHPGTRTSASGGTYSERRKNRSDVDRRKRL